MNIFFKFVIILMFITLFSNCFSTEDEIQFTSPGNNIYFDNFNESFGGFIEKKNYAVANKGLVTLKLDTSTTINYDIRNTKSVYYCVIRNDTAEVVMGRFHHAEVGDYVFFDGLDDNVSITKPN